MKLLQIWTPKLEPSLIGLITTGNLILFFWIFFLVLPSRSFCKIKDLGTLKWFLLKIFLGHLKRETLSDLTRPYADSLKRTRFPIICMFVGPLFPQPWMAAKMFKNTRFCKFFETKYQKTQCFLNVFAVPAPHLTFGDLRAYILIDKTECFCNVQNHCSTNYKNIDVFQWFQRLFKRNISTTQCF